MITPVREKKDKAEMRTPETETAEKKEPEKKATEAKASRSTRPKLRCTLFREPYDCLVTWQKCQSPG